MPHQCFSYQQTSPDMQEERYEHTVLFISRIKGQELPRRRGVAGADAPLPAEVVEAHSFPSPVLQLWDFQPMIHFRSRKQRMSLRSAAIFPQQEQVQTGQDLSQISKICPKLFCPGEDRSLQHEALQFMVIVSQGLLRGSAPSRTAQPSPPPRPQ